MSNQEEKAEAVFQDALERRLRHDLPEGRPHEQVHAILDRPDAEGFIQTLDPQVLFRLIESAGWHEAHDLVPYATPWQIQVFLDFDGWKKDRFAPAKLERWLGTLVLEASDEKFQRVMRELDPEIPALFFKHNLEVDVVEEGEIPPQFADKPVSLSPDGVYAIVYPEDEVSAALMRSLIDRLYETDRVLAWTLLEAVRWEIYSTMEEEAYRWRNSRLEEFGYVSRDEAVEIYRYRNPTKLRQKWDAGLYGEKLIGTPDVGNLPVVHSGRDDDLFFFEAFAKVTSDEARDRLTYEMAAVQNRALIGDGIEPGDVLDAQNIARRTLGFLSLGLEFLSRSDVEDAAEVLERMPLRDVFAAGHSLCWTLTSKVHELRRRPTLTLIEGERFSLLSESDQSLFQALTRPRPEYASLDGDVSYFDSQAQVDEVAARLGMIAFKQLWLFAVRQVAPATLATLVYSEQVRNSPPTVTFDSLFRTSIALGLTSGDTELRGLSAAELEELAAVLRSKPWGDDPIGHFEGLIGAMLEALPPATVGFASAWLKKSLSVLEEELGGVREIEQPEFFETVVLLA